MPSIDTLISDIHNVFLSNDVKIPEEKAQAFGLALGALVKSRLEAVSNPDDKSYLRMSNVGSNCNRKLYYDVNDPSGSEVLPVEARIKFLYGDILEALLLFLADIAGHEVTGCQDKVEFMGVPGTRDAVIDGTLVDVKSASTFAFNKFAKGTLAQDDPFGYIPQLSLYLEHAQTDPKVTNKDTAYFFVIDKTLGHMCLSPVKRDTEFNWKIFVAKKQQMLENDKLPVRAFMTEPEGASGNQALGTSCSYCRHKYKCWPGLRTFLYSSGPKFLTTVAKLPKVPEITIQNE